MSQATQSAPRPGGQGSPGTKASSSSVTKASARGVRSASPAAAAARRARTTLFTGTPGRMRIIAAVCAALAAALGIVAAASLMRAAGSLTEAQAAAAQVVRLQGVSTNLVKADAAVTNAFLSGGLESADSRTAYTSALSAASSGIADAAADQPFDSTALAVVNTNVTTYAGTVEQARAFNREGFPAGAAYMRNASSALRSDALPALDAAISANQKRADDQFGAATSMLVVFVLGAVAVAASIGAAVWLARRTHRVINLGLTIGSVAMIIALVVISVTTQSLGRTISDVRANQYDGTLAISTARSAAFDAKANEALTLIFSPSGADYEARFKAQSGNVSAKLSTLSNTRATDPSTGSRVATTTLGTQWKSYTEAHGLIRAKDDGNDWAGAVALAQATTPNSANATFAAFDQTSQKVLDGYQSALSEGLSAPRTGLIVTAWIILIICLVGAVACIRGFSARIKEYQ